MGYVEQAVYDKGDRVSEEIDALNQKMFYSYDKNGRVISITNKSGETSGFAYDPHGNVIVMKDRTGLKTNLEYDLNDNLTRVTDPLGGITNYGYDNMNRMEVFTNAAGKKTEYSYDLEGNLTSITNPEGKKETFAYDEKGRLTAHGYASGKKTFYDYNKLNNLLEKSYEDAKGKETEAKVSYTYNSYGERVSMKDAAGQSTYEYDELGRIRKVVNGSGKAVDYIYDAADNLQQITYPDGTKATYEYDLNNNLVKVTDRKGKVTEYKHDALNRVTETIRPNGTKTAITYDPEDHVTKLVNICISCTQTISSYEYEYNAQGYIVSEKATELEAGTRKEPSWEDWYNWGGNKVTEETDCCHEEKTVKTDRTYEYDDNWELIRCTEKVEGGKKTVHSYTYDKVGNRTYYEETEDGVQKAKYKYEYNAANQMVRKKNCKIWGDKGVQYQYDGDGNLLRTCENDYTEPTEYEYTAENRLAVVRQGRNVLMAALYDGDGNRVFQIDNTYSWEDCYGDEVLIPAEQRTEDESSPAEQLAALLPNGANTKGYTLTEYINDINMEHAQVLIEYSASDEIRQAYTYGETRVSVDKAGETSYYINDGRFNVIGLVTESGKLTNSYRYDPYGNLASGTADAVNYYGYNAESTNTNTNLQYLRARYYAPAVGRFLTEDTYMGDETRPLSTNLYGYVENNPVNYQDPSGNMPTAPAAGGSAKPAKTTKTTKSSGGTAKKSSKSSTSKSTASKKKTTTTNKKSSSSKKSSSKKKKSGVFSKFTNWVSKKAKNAKDTVKRELCNVKKKVTTLAGKVDWKTVGKAAVGVAVLAGLGVAAITTGGLATVVFAGAATGGISGGISSRLSSKSVIDGVVSGIINGAVTTAVTMTTGNPYAGNIAGGFVGSVAGVTLQYGTKASAKDYATSVFWGTASQTFFGGMGSSMTSAGQKILGTGGKGMAEYVNTVFGVTGGTIGSL